MWEALKLVERSVTFRATLTSGYLIFLEADFGTEGSVVEVVGLVYEGLVTTETSIFGSRRALRGEWS